MFSLWERISLFYFLLVWPIAYVTHALVKKGTLCRLQIVGHGVDITDVAKIKQLLERADDHFLTRCFTKAEQITGKSRIDSNQYFAGRFAAKESVMKALGTGWSQGISWLEIEITTLASGVPSVLLYGRCAEVAANLGVVSWWLSISHTETSALASAIAVGTSKPT